MLNNLKAIVLNKSWIVLLVFVLISLFLYRNTENAGLVFDFNGWAAKYNQSTFKDAFHSFGYPGLHQIEQISFFTAYSLLGFNGTYWYVLFSMLHALNAFLLFIFSRKILSYFSVKQDVLSISIFSSFLFLISPFATDVVASKVCIHYLLISSFILSCFYFYISFLEKNKLVSLLASLAFFILALFSLELAYMIPIAILTLTTVDILYHNKALGKSISKVFYFCFVLLLFLGLHKWVIGSFIGHYGSEIHTKFVLGELVSNYFYYLLNYVLFFDFWNYNHKILLLDLISKFWYLITLFFIVVFALILLFRKKILNEYIIPLLLILLFSIALLPILNLYCVTLQTIENDRYGYVASLFIYIFIAYLIFTFNKKYVAYFLSFVLLIVNFYFLSKNISAFEEMGDVSKGLIEDFRWEDKSKIYILVQPDNHSGARSFTTLKTNGSEFAESLYLERGIDIRDKTTLIYEININSANDSIKVTQLDSLSYNIEVGYWGAWFWKYHLGATSLETEKYKTIIESGLSFQFHLKEALKEDEVIIYANGSKWKELIFN